MIVTENLYHGETAKWRRMNSKRIPTRETSFVEIVEGELLDLLDSRWRFEIPVGAGSFPITRHRTRQYTDKIMSESHRKHRQNWNGGKHD